MTVETSGTTSLVEELARYTFTAPERWGWQYVRNFTPASTAVGPEPVWQPQAQQVHEYNQHQADIALRKKLLRQFLTVFIGSLVGLVAVTTFFYEALGGNNDPDAPQPGFISFLILIAVIGIAVGLLGLLVVTPKFGAAKSRLRRSQDAYQQLVAQYQAQVARWQAAVDQYNAWVAGGPFWFPILPAFPDRRLDVFGGDEGGNGWSHLLATMGTSLLADARSIGLLDLTGMDVGGNLLRLAGVSGVPWRRLDLPDDLGEVDLLHGLSPDALAELVSRAVGGVARPGAGAEDRRLSVLRTGVLRTIAQELAGQETGFARLAAGVQVLRQTYQDGPLTHAEVVALNDQVNKFSAVRDAGDELFFLEETLTAFAAAEGPERVPLWSADGRGLFTRSGLAVIATAPDAHRRDRKEMLDLLLVLLAQRATAVGGAGSFPDVLIVAGADGLGVQVLEDLSTQCQRNRIRLVLLMEHLRDDLNTLIGSGSTVLLMRLGNNREAEAAAAFIGRDHKFVLSGMTYENGSSNTTGGEEGSGGQGSTGSSYNYQSGNSTNQSRSESWSKARSWGQSTSTGTNEAYSRVQELLVEPHQIQNLPPTAFILVDNAAGGRRVVSGDCNPGIALRAGQVSAIPNQAS